MRHAIIALAMFAAAIIITMAIASAFEQLAVGTGEMGQ